MVYPRDVERVPALSIQDGELHPGVLTQVGVRGGDASDLSSGDGQFGNGEGPHTCGRQGGTGVRREVGGETAVICQRSLTFHLSVQHSVWSFHGGVPTWEFITLNSR